MMRPRGAPAKTPRSSVVPLRTGAAMRSLSFVADSPRSVARVRAAAEGRASAGAAPGRLDQARLRAARREKLEGAADVYSFPRNGGDTSATLKQLEGWLKEGKAPLAAPKGPALPAHRSLQLRAARPEVRKEDREASGAARRVRERTCARSSRSCASAHRTSTFATLDADHRRPPRDAQGRLRPLRQKM